MKVPCAIRPPPEAWESRASSASVTRLPAPTTALSRSSSASAGTPSCAAASPTSWRRRSATAARQALPTANAVRLPCAPKSNGVANVSAETTLMSARSTPSSSASTCAAPVSAAVPISAAPVLSATVPSGLIFTYTPEEPPVVVHQPHASPLPRSGGGPPVRPADRRRRAAETLLETDTGQHLPRRPLVALAHDVPQAELQRV